MFYVWCILLIVCGTLAAASLIIQKQPNAKELIDKIAPFQGILGVILFIGGVLNLVNGLIHISLIRLAPTHYLVGLGFALTMTLLGMVLGYGLINQYVLSRNAAAAEQGVQVQRKLVAIQVPLGLAGIALAVCSLVMVIAQV